METISSAIRLNNEGVSLLLTGDDAAATEALTKSLTFIRQQLYNINSYDRSESPRAEHTVGTSKAPLTSPSMTMNLDQRLLTSAPLPHLEDHYYFIYNQAVTITPESSQSPNVLHLYSACIIFNLALGYHRRGIQGNPLCMQKAEIMYEMASKLMKNDKTNSDVSILLQVAIVNNLAQIRYAQGKLKEAREGMNCLVYLIHKARTGTVYLKQEDINGILLNMLLLSPLDVAPAA